MESSTRCEIHLGQGGNWSSSAALAILRRCGSAVERLSLRGVENIDDVTILLLCQHFTGRRLQSLDLGGCPNVSGATVASLVGIQSLCTLHLDSMMSFQDEHLSALCTECPVLTRLHVRYCEWLTDASVLLSRRADWASLQLDGCFRLDVRTLLGGGVWSGSRV